MSRPGLLDFPNELIGEIFEQILSMLFPEVGMQTFVKSPQIANSQILGLIPLSQIR
jgi:hypothetical protein